jgi:integrase
MRKGEILKLTWRNVDLRTGSITVTARNSKTERPRTVQMTERLKAALAALFELSTRETDARIFGVFDNVKKSFNTVRKAAGLPDVRFHDLRHTCATRLFQSHMPIAEVARILGHSSISTTYRYTNADSQTQQRAADLLNAFNDAPMIASVN